MKRFGNLWPLICDRSNIELAADRALVKHKYDGMAHSDYTKAQKYFIEHRQELLDKLERSLKEETYKLSPLHQFKVYEPKERVIHCPPYYPDKVLHHCLMNVVKHLFYSKFTHDTFNCIEGRGIITAKNKIESIIRAHPDWYVYLSDVHHYYPSIKHSILKQQLRRVIKCKKTIALFDAIIDNHWDSIDEDGEKRGIAIGIYPDQVLANLHLTPHDHRVKEELHAEYIRFMDNEAYFGTKEDCKRYAEFDKKEKEALGLQLNKDARIVPVRCGFDLIGYVFYPTHTRLRKRIKLNMKRRAKQLERQHVSDETYKQQMASFYGWCKHANCRHLMKTIMKDKFELFTQKDMEAKRLSDFRNKKWFGMDHDRFISTFIYNDRRLYENDFTVLEMEEHTFRGKNGIVVHLQIDGEDYYTITTSGSLVARFPRAWESVGNEPFIARLQMQQSQSDMNHKYPILV